MTQSTSTTARNLLKLTLSTPVDHIMASLKNRHNIKIEEDIEKFIKAEAYRNQLRIKEFFEDYDKLRKGYITEDKFRTGLSNLKLHLDELHIQSLIQRYRLRDGLIDYVSFCDNVEQQFYDNKEAMSNLNAVRSKSVYEEHERQLLRSILSYLRKEISSKRILVKPSLQDFDRINTCHVTYEQFTRALNKIGLSLPDICFKVLARKYMDKNNTREVNYVNFLQDVDDAHLMYGDSYGIPEYLIQKQREYESQRNFEETNLVNEKFNESGGVHAANQSANLQSSGQLGVSNQMGEQWASAQPEEEQVDNTGFFTNNKESTRPEFGGSQLNTVKNVGDLERKIKADIVMRDIRIHQFFIDIDKLRKGYCSSDQFRRVMDLTGIGITDEQLEMLYQKYRLPDGMFNYRAFSDNIRSILTTKGIQKDPLHQVYQINSDTTLPARRYFVPLTQDEKTKLQHLLGLIKKEIETRRLLFKPHFQDFDQTNNGYVTRSQFLRVLYQFDIYPSNEYLNVLLKCYTDNGNLNEVNYNKFCKDVDGQDTYTKKINDVHASKFFQAKDDVKIEPYIYKDVDCGYEDVISKLQKKVKEERIRVREFLRDFDRLRSGSITSAQLRIGLNMAKLPLSNKEFKILCNHFACSKKPGWFRWREFSDTVDEVFTVKGLEKNPDSKIGGSILLTQTVRQKMNPQDRQLAEKIIKKFTHYVKATRLYIKQFFQDWDRLGRNKVSPKQFRQVLATVNFNMDENQCRVICDYFMTEDGYVNYVDFIKATTPDDFDFKSTAQLASSNVLNKGLATQSAQYFQSQELGDSQLKKSVRMQKDPNYSEELEMMEKGHIPNYSYMLDLRVDPIKVLEKIKNEVKISRTRLREYFQDFDGLRKGLITQNKFFGSLDKLKIHLTPNETEALKRIYVDEQDETKRIRYIQFTTDVDKVFTTKGLQQNPTYRVNPYKKPKFLDPMDLLTEPEAEYLHSLLTEIGSFVRINRILIKPFFKDKDIARSGKVSFPRFRAILDQLGIHFTEKGYRLLSKRFSHEGVEFNYIEFDEVVKEYANDTFYSV